MRRQKPLPRTTRPTGAGAPRDARVWLAQELHDGPVQTLTGLIVELEGLRVGLDGPAVPEATGLVAAARSCMQELRTVLAELRDEAPPSGDLVVGVRELVARFETASGVPVNLHVPSTRRNLRGPRFHEVSRIVGEALANVMRHSGASAVDVVLEVKRDVLTVEVSDNGQGFTPSLTPAGFGRRGMFERSAVIGADLHVDGASGLGTTVRLTMPLRDTR